MTKKFDNIKVTNLFWTGGWDSTFRLLQLVLDEGQVVRPHYIITAQESTGMEIKTIVSIRGKLADKYPETRELLRPIRFFDVREIEHNEQIKEEYERIKKTEKINYQYEFLARYCHQHNIEDVELCIFEDHRDYFKEGSIFSRYFSYPLLGLTKKEMAEISGRKQWDEFMYETWFCRLPKNGKPCGLCGPCTDALVYGMEKRLPLKARLIARLQAPFRKYWRKNYNKRSNKLFKFVARILEGKY